MCRPELLSIRGKTNETNLYHYTHDWGLSPNTENRLALFLRLFLSAWPVWKTIGENDKRVREGHILAVAIHLVMSPVDIRQGSQGPRTSPGDLLIFQPRASTHLL